MQRRGIISLFSSLCLVALAACLFVAPPVRADECTDCMVEKLKTADGKMTIDELRRQCRQEVQARSDASLKNEGTAVAERRKQDRDNVLKPFTLMAHKPNYILFGAYNSSGYSPDLYQQEHNDPTLEMDDTEIQFQVSIKTPLAVDLFDRIDLYGAYTVRSFWQAYNEEESSPFRETNHEPEVWGQFYPNLKILGFNNSVSSIGLVHQSNGRGGALSRSWNRMYATAIFDRGDLAISAKPWYRFEEDKEDDDNPDIEDYLGNGELRVAYRYKEHVFAAMGRNLIESGCERGAGEFAWSFPLWKYPYLKGYIQYFTGYGESLIDYDKYVNKIGFGVSFTDWL